MALFQGVDVRTSEVMEQEARRLASVLKPRLAWWDNYRAPEGLDMAMSRFGPVSYSGVLIARPVAETTMGSHVVNVTQAQPDHLLLMGILGGPRMKSPEALHQFPQILRRTAVLLGAPSDGIEEFRNSMQLVRDPETGEVELATHGGGGPGASPLLPGASHEAPKLVVPGRQSSEAQSITLKWPYRE